MYVFKRLCESLNANPFLKDIHLVTGHYSSLIKNTIGDGSHWGVSISYSFNKKYLQTNNIYSAYLTKDILFGKDFVLLNGDVLFSSIILKKMLSETSDISISVDSKKELGNEEMKVAINSTGRPITISKDIHKLQAHGEYIGMSKFTSEGSIKFYETITDVINKFGYTVFYEFVFQRLMDEQYSISVCDIGKYAWTEIDTKEDLKQAQLDFS